MRANNEISHPSTLENIDTAIYRFVDETLNPHTRTNAGIEKVNVLWMGTERTFQIKNNKELRDKVGKLRLPLITISRASVSRDDAFKGSVQAAYVGGDERITIRKVIQQDKTQNFQNASRKRQEKGDETGPVSTKKIVYETISIPKPTYLNCMFEINIRTEYQQQMNELLPLFMSSTKNYFIENNGYQYEAFIQDDYGINSNQANLGQDERMFNAKVQIKVLEISTKLTLKTTNHSSKERSQSLKSRSQESALLWEMKSLGIRTVRNTEIYDFGVSEDYLLGK